ncbi:sulfotransferase [Candidatus Pelagibacter sp.]|nr:sulfotransferase [Candidatus Pelagibacter sp.]|tara:strand:- start:887 stop:2440 length:1554 start_codon:yes stop_codon:yes gene_type:complete
MELKKKVDQLLKDLKFGKFNKVISDGEKLLKKHQDKGYLFNICGLAHQRLNNIETSISYFKKAISLEPDKLGNKNNLANSYIYLNQHKEAENIFKEILKIEPTNVPALVNYARLKNILLDFKNSINLYQKALKFVKNDLGIWLNLSSVYQSLGEFKEAKDILKKILEINPNYIPAHISISKINNYSENTSNFKEMINLNRLDKFNKKEKSDLEFAIGKAYDDQKNYELSIKYFDSANKRRKELVNYNFKSDEKLFKSIKNYFENVDINNIKKNENSKKIIFIVGLPRSGTTLLEQILSAHNKVFGAGELDFLRQIIKQFFVQDNKLLPQKINELRLLNNNIINDKYFSYLENLNNNSIVTIDKGPQNFMWLGFIKLFFKNVKIIHSKRNLKDTFLSTYKNNFPSKDMDWAYDPSEIIRYFNFYNDHMSFWKKICGDIIYDVDYENIINNKENEIRNLLNYCELDWDENCLNHHQSKNTMIKTVSAYQARKPIYKTSIDSNKNYLKSLEKYFNQLNYK